MTTDFRDNLIPNPLETDRQHDRFYHLDVSHLGDEELNDEFYFLRPLLWGLGPEHWLRERVMMLEKERRKRAYTSDKVGDKREKETAKGVAL